MVRSEGPRRALRRGRTARLPDVRDGRARNVAIVADAEAREDERVFLPRPTGGAVIAGCVTCLDEQPPQRIRVAVGDEPGERRTGRLRRIAFLEREAGQPLRGERRLCPDALPRLDDPRRGSVLGQEVATVQVERVSEEVAGPGPVAGCTCLPGTGHGVLEVAHVDR